MKVGSLGLLLCALASAEAFSFFERAQVLSEEVIDALDKSHRALDSSLEKFKAIGDKPVASEFVQVASELGTSVDNVARVIDTKVSPAAGPISDTVVNAVLSSSLDDLIQSVQHYADTMTPSDLSQYTSGLQFISSALKSASNLADTYNMKTQAIKLKSINEQISAIAHQDPTRAAKLRRNEGLDIALSDVMALQFALAEDVENFEADGSAEKFHEFIDSLLVHSHEATEIARNQFAKFAEVNELVSKAASAPLLVSYVSGLDKLVSAVAETSLDKSAAKRMNILADSTRSLASAAAENNLEGYSDTLQRFAHKLNNIASSSESLLADEELSAIDKREVGELLKRENFLTKGVKSAVNLVKQRFDAFKMAVQKGGKRPVSAALTNLLAGLDGQIDNLLGIVGTALNPLTDGLSKGAVHAILGPTFQSLTDGIEVLLGNVVGAPLDLLVSPAMHMLSGNLKNVAKVADKFDLKDTKKALAKQGENLEVIAKKGHKILKEAAGKAKK